MPTQTLRLFTSSIHLQAQNKCWKLGYVIHVPHCGEIWQFEDFYFSHYCE